LLLAKACTKGKCEVALLAHDLDGLAEFEGRGHVHHKAVRRGIRCDGLGVWTVNERRAIGRMVRLGVRMLITDEPILAREILQERIRGKANR
jgi:glycerophosphoryl diester phosphodiesterase